MSKKSILNNIDEIKASARKNLAKGALTENYHLDVKEITDLLNNALATEIVCFLRYKKHYYKASDLGASVAAAEFLEHANQEAGHADSLAKRIQQLGGEPDLNPATLTERSHADYVDCDTIEKMIEENLVAERIAIDSYRQIVEHIGNQDPTTRSLLESILAVEEEHADDLLEVAAEYRVKF